NDQCIGNAQGARCESFGQCGCDSQADCSATTACNAGPGFPGVCVPSCLIDGGTNCAASIQVCNPATALCVNCLTDSDCTSMAPYLLCSSDIDAGNNCVQCFTPDQCPDASPGCNSSFYFCGGCAVPSDCPADSPLCHFGQCVPNCVLPDGGTYCA